MPKKFVGRLVQLKQEPDKIRGAHFIFELIYILSVLFCAEEIHVDVDDHRSMRLTTGCTWAVDILDLLALWTVSAAAGGASEKFANHMGNQVFLSGRLIGYTADYLTSCENYPTTYVVHWPIYHLYLATSPS